MMTKIVPILLLALSGFIGSCNGDGEKLPGAEGGADNGDANLTAWLETGAWQGIMLDKSAKESSGLGITLRFFEGGKFKLESKDNGLAFAAGRYVQFENSILFNVLESNISTFGLSASSRDMVYSRFGNTLRIFDDRTEIKLTSRDFSEEEALEGYSIFGQWQGTDLFSNVWSVIIKNEQTFEASAGNRSQQSLIISGAVQVVDSEAPKRAKLVVERTNNPDTRGMALEVVLLTADILQVQVLNQNQEEAQIFTCKRKL